MDYNNNTLFIGKVLLAFESLDSTNAYASNLLANEKPVEGTVITAKNQFAGRGQMGNSWESAAGSNLALSIILYPHFLVIKKQFLLNQAIALGILDFTKEYFPSSTKIKWPNDIYIGHKKVAGILIQNTLKGHQIGSSIIGIGINVNQKEFSKNAPNPTSFVLESNKSFDLDFIQNQLFKSIEIRYLQVKNQLFDKLEQDYLANLYNYQKEAIFKRPNGKYFKGVICGISAIGELQIQHGNLVEEFGLKEVIQVV